MNLDEIRDRVLRLLDAFDIVSIDFHTPMWLWSRGGFEVKL